MEFKIVVSYCQSFTQITKLKANQTLFLQGIIKSDMNFFIKKKLKHFNNLQSRNFSAL